MTTKLLVLDQTTIIFGASCLQIRLADIGCSEFVQTHVSHFKLNFLLLMQIFLE